MLFCPFFVHSPSHNGLLMYAPHITYFLPIFFCFFFTFTGAFVDMYNVNPKNCMVDKNGVINALGHHYIGA